MRISLHSLESPIGGVSVATRDDDAVLALELGDGSEARIRARLCRNQADALVVPGRRRSVPDRLRAYFDGDLAALDGLVDAGDGTEFQRAVWRALRAVPCGTTTSYGALAAAIGRPRAVRAVGSANANNPIALLVPCHRVIGSDGALRGYAGGLWRKDWLLQHEGALPARQLSLASS